MHLCRGSEKVLRKVRLTVVNSGRVLFPFDLEEEKKLILFQGNTTYNFFGKAYSCIHSSKWEPILKIQESTKVCRGV